MLKTILTILATIVMVGMGQQAVAEERPCTREGMNSCFSFQFANLRHTDADERMIRGNPRSGTKTIYNRVVDGRGDFIRAKSGGHLFIWLKPEVANDPSYRIPAELMREFRYSASSPNPTVSAVQFETNPRNFPVLDDPQLPNLGDPHYVLVSQGGTGGLGWSIPVSLRDKIAYVVYCPDGLTSWPNRRNGASMGIHFPPGAVAEWKKNDWEHVFQAVLHVR